MLISAKPEKLASNLMMNITKIEKTQKSESLWYFSLKSGLKSKNFHKFLDLSVSPIFVI